MGPAIAVILTAWLAAAWVLMIVLGIVGAPVSWGSALVVSALLGSLKVFSLALAEGLRRQE